MSFRSVELGLILKVAVSLLLLTIVIASSDLRAIWRSIAEVDLVLLLASSILFLVGYGLTSVRWRMLLEVRGVVVKLSYLIRSFFVASFFNNLLPSNIGGDVVRVYDSWRLGIGKADALGTVMLDRAIGMLALGVYALLGLSMFPAVVLPPALPIAVLGAVLASTMGVLFLFSDQKLLSAAASACDERPRLRRLVPLLQMFEPFAGKGAVLVRCFGVSLLLQGNVILYYWILAQALGFSIGYLDLAFVIPIALIVLMIPITINGIGLREGILVLLLGYYGISSAEAVAFSVLIYLQTVVQGVLGGIVFAFRSERGAFRAASKLT